MLLPAKNLFIDKHNATKNNKNILILLHLADCPWCHFVIDEVLAPMTNLKEYTDKLIIRQIEFKLDYDIVNFDNKMIGSEDFNRYYKLDFYPSVLLFNNAGVLLQKIIGVANKDFYWTQLDKILNKI